MIDIKSLTLEELQAELKKMGQPSFRAGQIFKWLHEGVKSFDEMTNISKSLREELGQKCYISSATIEKKLVSDYDDTVKYLFSFRDG